MSEVSIDQGIHEIPEIEYHKIKAASKSGLDQINKSPQHFISWQNEEIKLDTPAMLLGRAVHCGILEPERFYKTHVGMPYFGDGRTKIAQDKKKEFMSLHDGKIVISEEDFKLVENLTNEVHSHQMASALLTNGKSEQTLIWNDPIEKVKCKGRIDYLRQDGVIVDLKTTESAMLHDVQRSVMNYRYHVQSSFYSDGVKLLTDHSPETYVLLMVEKSPPFGVRCFVLDDYLIDLGRTEYRKNLYTYADCLRKNEWPGYPNTLETLTAPKWA